MDPLFDSNQKIEPGEFSRSQADGTRVHRLIRPHRSHPSRESQFDSPENSSVRVHSSARPIEASSSGKLAQRAFLFSATAFLSLFFAWYVGPRLVQEYYYAASLGQAKAEYDHAVGQLDAAPLTQVSLAYQLVAQRIKPSVVSLRVIKGGRAKETEGIGSGVILSEDGYLLTNAHVVKDGRVYEVKLYNRHVYRAELVGIDPGSDLAVLKIEAPDLIPAEWGDSDEIDVGSMVWAVGSPYGFQHTITSGILSGKDRPGERRNDRQSLLQTDAAVNPGNSGGPLVDSQGRVIGINTSIFGETFQGISFAVPSTTARFVFEELVAKGRVSRGYLGVRPSSINSWQAQRLKIPDLNGARLNYVEENSPAARAGFRPGDVIRKWNGQTVKDDRQLFSLAEYTTPQSEVEVEYVRRGEAYRTRVTLGEREELPTTTPSAFTRGIPLRMK